MAFANVFGRKFDLLYVTLNKSVRNYSSVITSLGKKIQKKNAVIEEKKYNIPVETDPYKLLNYVCGSNLLAENGETIKIKPDAEYPDWLWTLHIGEPLKLEEMDENSLQYWRKVRKMGKKRHNYLKSFFSIYRDHK